MAKRNPEMRGISRIDSKGTHGWFVRIYMRDREVHSKLFSDKKLGGKDEALELARQYRDEYVIPEDKLPVRPTMRYYKKAPKNNKTGVVGVCKTFERSNGGKGKKIPCYGVSWVPEPNKPKNKKFYLSQYGSEEEAFKAAVAFRREKEVEIDQRAQERLAEKKAQAAAKSDAKAKEKPAKAETKKKTATKARAAKKTSGAKQTKKAEAKPKKAKTTKKTT